ncbi:MAG: choice-of-anchor L domain-containing protein [Acidimicrobiales bacterium]
MARIIVAAATLLLMGALVAIPASPASAAAATVGNGITTTDLSAPGMSPSALASALVSPGVSVSNVTFSGADAQAGLLHVVDPAVVSFNDGIILSSGDVANVVGPNSSDGITGDMAGPADADLNTLIAETQTVVPMTYDAAVLEFDFVPTASQVYFTYTFGSDEYLEWVNLFNDVFAFYVNGSNCATVPSGDPVTIDTINDTVNPALFRDNSYSAPPANPINIESDGLSVELICSAPVLAGQTNHMKLAIADTSDQILDSVVMLKAHSLSTTPPESCNDGVDNDDDLLIDDADDSCASSTTPPPAGGGGIGSGGSAPPFTGLEGTPILLDASTLDWTATPDALTTTWSVEGINGTVGSCAVTPSSPQPVGPGGAIATVTAVCPDDGEYVARVDGWDIEAKSAFDTDVDVFVHNAPPAVDLLAPLSGQVAVGELVDLTASVQDPGVSDAVSCSIDWGDGTVEAGVLSGTTCTGSHSFTTAGAALVAVTATDDAGDSSADAAMLTVVAGSTTVSASVAPSVRGQQVTFRAQTTAGTTGTMTFYDGDAVLGTRTVTNGKANLSTKALAAGQHDISAVFTATPTSTPVPSPTLVHQVDPASTSVQLSSNVHPSVTGQNVRITARVTAVAPGGGVPAGTVEIRDGSELVATKPLTTAGTAWITLKPTPGTHSYTATFTGSSDHLGSTTAVPLDQLMQPAATTVTVTSGANPSTAGQSVSFRATVRAIAPGSGVPSGTVSFYEDGVFVGTRTLSSTGVAALARKPQPGVHEITAVYSGSPGYGSAAAAPLVQTVS